MEDHPKAIEQIDQFKWEKNSKIITRDHHGISGLANISYFRRLSTEPATELHYHNGIMEIHCVSKGNGSCCIVKDDVTHHYNYTGNEAFIIFPNEWHYSGAEAQQPCEIYAVQLNMNEMDRFLFLDKETGESLCKSLMSLEHRKFHMSAESFALIRTAFDLVSIGKSESMRAAMSYLVCFIYGFLQLSPVGDEYTAQEDTRIGKAIEYIEENINEPLSLSELAEVSGYSLSHFKIRFRDATGHTPAYYITYRKVEAAKAALEKTNASITDIAYSYGWSTSNYFCSVFKKLTGMSPLRYRKLYRDRQS